MLMSRTSPDTHGSKELMKESSRLHLQPRSRPKFPTSRASEDYYMSDATVTDTGRLEHYTSFIAVVQL
jgi:hypothetical protein